MGVVIAYLLDILGLSSAVLSIANSILGIVGTTAQEHQKFNVERFAANAANTVNSPTFGNAALLAAINSVNDQVIAAATSLTLQIENLTDGTTPVSLPPTPPTGYGGLGDSATFDAVWLGLKSPDVVTPYEFLYSVGTRAEFQTGYATLSQADGNWYYYNQSYDQFGIAPSFFPVFDLALLDPADTLLSFVTTCNPIATCFWSPSTGLQVQVNGDSGDGTAHFLSVWNESTFQQLKASIFPVVSLFNPPVWPGLGHVTLGSPVAIASQLTVTGPMDGVIVTITSVSTSKPALDYDGEIAYKFIGGLSFVDDNGDVEPFQQLAFNNALYSPKVMTRAASVVVRADPSVAGTITPWVIA